MECRNRLRDAGEWCRVSPESGGAGPATVTVTAEANPDTRSRTAVLTIRAGGLTETVTFTQGEKGTVSLAQKVYQDIPAEGLSFDILFDGVSTATSTEPKC